MEARPDNPSLGGAQAQLRKEWVGDARGTAVSSVLTLATTVSYGTVAAGSLAEMGGGLAASMVLSGLIAASLGALVSSAMGSAQTQIFSPRASVSVIISAAAVAFGAGQGAPAGQVVGLLTICLLLSALMQLAFAGLRMGGLIRLIPHSVTAGLVIALSIKLAWSQLPDLFRSAQAHTSLVAPLVTGLMTLGAIALCRRWHGSGLGLLAGLIAGLMTAALVEVALPDAMLHLPAIDIHQGPLLSLKLAIEVVGMNVPGHSWSSVLGFAAVIALVNSFETLTSAMQLEELGGSRVDANRALMASACGSLMSLCAGGLPVAGSTSTSAAHVQAGATRRRAALASAALVGLGTLALGDAISMVPLAVVAGLMLSVAVDLAMSPVKELINQWRTDRDGVRGELAVVVLVGGLLLSAGILTAIAAGVVAASALAFVKMRDGLVRRQYSATGTGQLFEEDEEDDNGIEVIELGQPLFFATVETAVSAIDRVKPLTRFAVLDLGPGGGMDLTAAKALSRCASEMTRRGRLLLVVGGPQAAEFDAQLRPCLVFDHIGKALNYCVRQPSRAEPVTLAPSARNMLMQSTMDEVRKSTMDAVRQSADRLQPPARSTSSPQGTGTVARANPPSQPAKKDFVEAALYEEEDTLVMPRAGWSKETPAPGNIGNIGNIGSGGTVDVDIDLDLGIDLDITLIQPAPVMPSGTAFSPMPAIGEAPTLVLPRPPAPASVPVPAPAALAPAPAAPVAALRPAAPAAGVPANVPAEAAADDGPVPHRPSEATMKLASTLLAQYIGPVSTLFVKRAAQTATHRDQFCQLLAYHIEERSDREAFLTRMRASVSGEIR
jgi:SulP family sulfate permease